MSITSAIQFIYKNGYSNDAVARDVTKDHPLFADIARKGGFNGKGQFYSIKTANPQGVGKTVAVGQSAISTSAGVQPYVTRVTQYGFIRLVGEDMKAAPDDGAFYDYVTDQTDSIIDEVGNDLALELYGDATGARARISSINGQILTLTNAEDVRKFGIGMTIVGDNNASGASPNAGSTTIASIDEDSGTITCAAGGVAAANLIANDYLFRYGDGAACAEGLGLCTPLTAPTAGDSFRTIDRSTNVRKLAGVRLTGSGAIEEDIGLLAVKCKQNVKRAFDRFYINPINFHTVVQRAGAKIEYSGGGGEAGVGFESIVVYTEGGAVRLVSDPDCPTNLGYGVRMSEHFIWHLDDFPHIVRDAGSPRLQVYNADSVEIRIRAWWNYVQRMPGAFGVLSIV